MKKLIKKIAATIIRIQTAILMAVTYIVCIGPITGFRNIRSRFRKSSKIRSHWVPKVFEKVDIERAKKPF